jgi:predicted transcriptional regulator
MKLRNIKIAIKSKDELAEEVKSVWNRVEKGEKVQKKEGIYFENIETMRKVLTEERLRILKAIKKDRPSSIYALAKLLRRDTKNTFDDVHYLAQAGLISLKKKTEGREATTPVVDYDKIVLEISV